MVIPCLKTHNQEVVNSRINHEVAVKTSALRTMSRRTNMSNLRSTKTVSIKHSVLKVTDLGSEKVDLGTCNQILNCSIIVSLIPLLYGFKEVLLFNVFFHFTNEKIEVPSSKVTPCDRSGVDNCKIRQKRACLHCAKAKTKQNKKNLT